jgi:GDP-L-fucose synthase
MRVDGAVVVVTGGTGLLGQSVARELRVAGAQVLPVGRQDFDLRQHRQVWDMLRSIRPDAVVHLASTRRSGAESVLSHYDNVIMGVELLEACRRQRVDKVLLVERACAFPTVSTSELPTASSVISGDTDVDAAAHQMLRTHLEVYREYAHLDVATVALTNVYDASPDYSPELGAAVDTMLAAFRSAVDEGASEVRLSASSSPETEMLHLNDAAHLIRLALASDDAEQSARGVSLAELGGLVAEQAGYRGAVSWSPAAGVVGRQTGGPALEAMRDFVDWHVRTAAGTAHAA